MKSGKKFLLVIFALTITLFISACYKDESSVEGKSYRVESKDSVFTILFKKDEKAQLSYDNSKTIDANYIKENDKFIIDVYGYEYVLSFDGEDMTLISEGFIDKKVNKDGKSKAYDEISLFMHDDIEREYLLKLPDNHVDRPLLIVLHGFAGDIRNVDNEMRLSELTLENDYVVCYPQALSGKEKDGAYWNANWGLEGDSDDVDFLVSLAKYLVNEYDLDEEKVYVCGYSNGGFMSYTLAKDASDVFSKAVVMSGLMSENDWESKMQATNISILHIHGKDDSVIKIEDSEHYKMSARDIVEFWRGVNNAVDINEKKLGANTTIYKYTGTKNDVWYYEVANWGHAVPSKDKTDFDAKDVIYDFLESSK